MRKAGVLMSISSLPSKWGIGSLGKAAFEFLDFLHEAGQSYWQVLPIGPTGYGDSPYQSFSAFAGNPYFIDIDELSREGLLVPSDYENINWGEDPGRVDYGIMYVERFRLLRKAIEKLLERKSEELEAFFENEADWLPDYALFMAFNNRYGGTPWHEWPSEIKKRKKEAIEKGRAELKADIAFWAGLQYLFFIQWQRLHDRAGELGISIIGDIPIYVAEDSADVWAHPEQFQMDEELRPVKVAGCPPDGFSEKGQLWGNPLFDWERMKNDGYDWWIKRIGHQLRYYDVLRIDHFRGFESYYAIDRVSMDARSGNWEKGPGLDFFKRLEESLGKKAIIAEDLGFITPEVQKLLSDTGFPGMKVLQFAFDSRDGGGRMYQPHNYPRNCVAYVGTHDNDTALGWTSTAIPADVELAREYIHPDRAEGENWGMMRAIWASHAGLAIVQMQDLLGLGPEGRMNTPSTLGGNWTWRALPGSYGPELAERIYRQMYIYERL